MKRILHLLVLLASLIHPELRAQQPASASPPRHYLFVVDTSFSMASQKETLRNTIYDLLYTGIDGQIRPGDTFALWTFNAEVGTEGFPPLVWSAADNKELAAKAYEFLKAQSFERIGRLDNAIDEISRVTRVSGSIVALIFSDGVEFIRGTPFDREINAVYREQSSALRQAGKPVITLLSGSEGKMVNWTVTTVGEPIRIPALTPTTDRGPTSPTAFSPTNQALPSVKNVALNAHSQAANSPSPQPASRTNASAPQAKAATNALDRAVSSPGRLFLLPVFPSIELVDLGDRLEPRPSKASAQPKRSQGSFFTGSTRNSIGGMKPSDFVVPTLTLQSSAKIEYSLWTLRLASPRSPGLSQALLNVGSNSVYLASGSATNTSSSQVNALALTNRKGAPAPAVTASAQTNTAGATTNHALPLASLAASSNSTIEVQGSLALPGSVPRKPSPPAPLPSSASPQIPTQLAHSEGKDTNRPVVTGVIAPGHANQLQPPAAIPGRFGLRWQYLLAGAGLLTLALLLGYLMLRQDHTPVRESFITRSIERQGK